MLENAEVHELRMRRTHGPFLPHSDERRLRQANWGRGLQTCWNGECLAAFDPAKTLHRAVRSGGRTPWWTIFCSRECAIATGYLRDRRRFATFTVADDGEPVVLLDFGCKGCAA